MKRTRKEKRELEKKINYFREFLKIKEHFFKDFKRKLACVKDNRHQSYIKYPPEIILFTLIMKNVTGIVSMNKMTRDFNNDEAIANIGKSLDFDSLEEIPHYDTINNFLKLLEVTELEKIRDYMIRELFKKRSLEKYRLMNKYWTIAIDGSQLYSFNNEKHCEHCLKKEYKNKETGEIERTVYYHTVLEAKLIVGNMALSILTEFVENEDEDVSKQDCEIEAAKRLFKKLKFKFRKLNICILGDSLYACEPIYKLCNELKWKYIFRFKEGRASSLWDEFTKIKEINKFNKELEDFVNCISYHDEIVNITQFKEVKIKKDNGIEKEYITEFVFITNIKITKNNNISIIEAGRSRWKIENEGFNNQKNIRYDIEHLCCKDYTAMKNHYLIVQISDILRQLLECGSEALKKLNAGIREISSRLLESFRREHLTPEDISKTKKHIKIRYL